MEIAEMVELKTSEAEKADALSVTDRRTGRVYEIPITDGEGEDEKSFGIGAWVSLSEPNFKWYVDHPEADNRDQGDPWFGWLSNSVPVYPETLGLKTNVYWNMQE